MLDIFSKYVKLFPMKSANTKTILKKYELYNNQMGKCSKILSDLGSQFTAHSYIKTLEEWGVECCFTSVRHPSANPVERVMRELGRVNYVGCIVEKLINRGEISQKILNFGLTTFIIVPRDLHLINFFLEWRNSH